MLRGRPSVSPDSVAVPNVEIEDENLGLGVRRRRIMRRDEADDDRRKNGARRRSIVDALTDQNGQRRIGPERRTHGSHDRGLAIEGDHVFRP